MNHSTPYSILVNLKLLKSIHKSHLYRNWLKENRFAAKMMEMHIGCLELMMVQMGFRSLLLAVRMFDVEVYRKIVMVSL